MAEPLSLQQLRCLTPLNVLSEAQWRELRPQLVPKPVLSGQMLFRAGDQAQLCYYLLSGELLLCDGQGGQSRLVAGSAASLHPLSPNLPRQQQAQALTDLSVLVIDSALLNQQLA